MNSSAVPTPATPWLPCVSAAAWASPPSSNSAGGVKHEKSCHIFDKDTESHFVEKYDTLGNVLEFVDYSDTLKRCIYFYDTLGFLSEKRFFDINDSIVKKELFRCDEHGNWIERRLIDKNGKFLEGELREIEYFD